MQIHVYEIAGLWRWRIHIRFWGHLLPAVTAGYRFVRFFQLIDSSSSWVKGKISFGADVCIKSIIPTKFLNTVDQYCYNVVVDDSYRLQPSRTICYWENSKLMSCYGIMRCATRRVCLFWVFSCCKRRHSFVGFVNIISVVVVVAGLTDAASERIANFANQCQFVEAVC